MKAHFMMLFVLALVATTTVAQNQATQRVPEFSNNQVNVWKTIIYPTSKQVLTMHRHDHNRVVVALTDGLLKVTNDKGKIHYFRLQKDHAYYLAKDIPNELHKDENVTHKAIKVMVIELL